MLIFQGFSGDGGGAERRNGPGSAGRGKETEGKGGFFSKGERFLQHKGTTRYCVDICLRPAEPERSRKLPDAVQKGRKRAKIGRKSSDFDKIHKNPKIFLQTAVGKTTIFCEIAP